MIVTYYSRECQVARWPEHKKHCTPAPPAAPDMQAAFKIVRKLGKQNAVVSLAGAQRALINEADLRAVRQYEARHPEAFAGALDWGPLETPEVQAAGQMYAFNFLLDHKEKTVREEFQAILRGLGRYGAK
ncbi:hypothetical protein DFJ74DRAFT_707507 [Hyaloraphidium curvatum]|nr:hypothetical protein DFJ74DRAFT_707507 [Hyaloraphidium curvatum]